MSEAEVTQPNRPAPSGFTIPVSPRTLVGLVGILAAGGGGSVAYESFADPKPSSAIIARLDKQDDRQEKLNDKVELIAVHVIEVKAELQAERGEHERYDKWFDELRGRVNALESN